MRPPGFDPPEWTEKMSGLWEFADTGNPFYKRLAAVMTGGI